MNELKELGFEETELVFGINLSKYYAIYVEKISGDIFIYDDNSDSLNIGNILILSPRKTIRLHQII